MMEHNWGFDVETGGIRISTIPRDREYFMDIGHGV